MIEFLNMGGYAFFIWGSYGIAFSLLFILYYKSTKDLSKFQQKFKIKVTSKSAVNSLPQQV